MARNSESRQSKHTRSRTPSVMIVQKRDIEIVKAVFQYRYLTRSQIQRLFEMKSVSRVNIRLRKLYDSRFLDRYYQAKLLGSSEAVYSIGSFGLQILSESLEMDIAEIKRRRRSDRVAKNRFVNHNLMVNDFRINLILDFRKRPEFSFVRWLDPRDCEFKFIYKKSGKQITSSIKPDGYFEFIYQNKSFSFFVEVDLTTSNHSKLKSKLANYLIFKNQKLFKQEFGKEVFYVLVITKSVLRADNLHQISSSLKSDMFWFSALANTTDNILFGEIWKQSGQNKTRAFFKLPKVRIVR